MFDYLYKKKSIAQQQNVYSPFLNCADDHIDETIDQDALEGPSAAQQDDSTHDYSLSLRRQWSLWIIFPVILLLTFLSRIHVMKLSEMFHKIIVLIFKCL